jgi:hypothetical protein
VVDVVVDLGVEGDPELVVVVAAVHASRSADSNESHV